MKYLVAFTIIFLIGIAIVSCGSGDVEITILEINKPRMDAMCDEDYECYGYATWGETINGRYCTIFMLPSSYYPNNDDYEYVLGHETRHCFEGEFH